MINTKALEFDNIREMLKDCAFSAAARERIDSLAPYMDEAECIRHMRDTTAARSIIDALGTPPLPMMEELDELLTLSTAGAMLLPEQLGEALNFGVGCRRAKRYLAKAEQNHIAAYGESITGLEELCLEIERCIRHNQVDTEASTALHNIRRQMDQLQQRIKEKLGSLLAGNGKWFSDNYVVQRNGRQVLPVKREHRNSVKGEVVEISASKSTYFIEPASVAKLTEQLHALEVEEDAEVRRILYTLSGMVAEHEPLMRRNMELMAELDFVFAKARLSQRMDAVPADINTDRRLDLRRARHPLLRPESCVPLDFSMCNDRGDRLAGVIITGPNTGGKTVAIKTVGLLSLMAQCGLHIPADAGSSICMHSDYHCDIGDSQSISENLSTFSGHITNIIGILADTGPESLVLLDELGSGTDPAEGMGIAIAVLEELLCSGCMFLATTHYPEVKDFAESTAGVVSARMAFNRETLSPEYRLEMGKSGESCALYIAQRLGLPGHILARAYDAAYQPKSPEQGADNTAAKQGVAVESMLPSFAWAGGQPVGQPVSKPKREGLRKLQAQPQQEQLAGQEGQRAALGIGDTVSVQPEGRLGIVYSPADDMGRVGVQIKGEKQLISHKRLKLRVPASELYPEGYDFSIIFDTVENRKARHQLSKGHRPGVIVEVE